MITTSIKIDEKKLAEMLAKSRIDHPANVLYPTPWASIQSHPKFGATQLFWVLDEAGNFSYDSSIRTETPGEADVVVRENDLAIAFIKKYRANVLPRTEENIAWRKTGNLDLTTAPHLGMFELGIARGWIFNPKKHWELIPMTEGQQETGLMVHKVEPIGYGYPNSGVISTWVDMFWGVATDKPYTGPIDELEKPEIQKVVWLSLPEVREYMLTGSDNFSLAALGKFRMFAIKNENPFLQEVGKQL
ncbi:MAG: hypothetical protein NTZ07_01890 [Candidatus Woesebacteria bacterium]|nr:hypothetical protein [Candidatus Woesebacteria bacterium]